MADEQALRRPRKTKIFRNHLGRMHAQAVLAYGGGFVFKKKPHGGVGLEGVLFQPWLKMSENGINGSRQVGWPECGKTSQLALAYGRLEILAKFPVDRKLVTRWRCCAR